MPRSGQTWDVGRLEVLPEIEPFAALLSELASFSAFPAPDELTEWVDRGRLPDWPESEKLHFVPPRVRARRAKRGPVDVSDLYDARISEKREVPCLPQSYHDLFNALMFRAFPRAKRALHARQYSALRGWAEGGASGLPGRRTREQDALTLFDEGGSVVVCPTDLEARFAAGGPLGLERVGSTGRLVIFGHALVEHLSEGQGGLRSTARVLFVPEVPAGASLLELVDEFLARLLADPQRFREPDADAVVLLDRDGLVSFRRFDPEVRLARTAQLRTKPAF